MAEKMIRHLLYTYGREVPNPFHTEGGNEPETHVVEGLARLGEVVDISRPYDLERGERLGAFYTDEERAAIEDGSYRGADAPSIQQARLETAQQAIQPADGEGVADASSMSSEEIADLIEEQKLNVQQTIALAGDDEDSINKVLDAENLATNNEPRSGVVKGLEAKLAEASG